MSPIASKPSEYFLDQSPSPGTAASEVAEGFAKAENTSGPLPKLFQPLKIRDVTAKNRLWVSPMCMYSAEDGFTTDFHFAHYSQFATHGAGLIMVEATGVTPEGRITPNCLGLWKDEQIDGLRRIVNHLHKYGAVAGIQLGHAGRKASTIPLHLYGTRPGFKTEASEGGWPEEVYGPSAIAYDEDHWTPKELTIEGIHRIQQAFVDAAERAGKAGFDVIELHGAHGYLITEFLSPLSNQRTDKYGGSLENRTQFLLEIVRDVRKVWPEEKPLFVRVSATEWVEDGGWSINDTVALAKALVNEGVDLLDCSSGGNIDSQAIPVAPGYQVPFATQVKENVPGLLTAGVGLITGGAQANDILEEDKADAVFSARAFLRNPALALTAAHELGVNIKWAHQYERGRPKTRHTFA
ncbi:NADH:flavin oxidoreductase/NADH oxidase, partial [Martensiomyces pterosporus]